MGVFLHAVRVFFEHLAAVGWSSLLIACVLHVVRLAVRAHAWRRIVAAAYPGIRVPRRGTLGAYLAGVGINSITPARGGDAAKLYLLKQRVQGSTYPTLASTLFVETIFDLVVASALTLWAVHLGVLPGLGVLPHLPSVDWAIAARHPAASAIVAALLLLALAAAGIRAAGRVVAFKRHVAQGWAILRQPGRYLRTVASWQAVSFGLRLASVYWFLKAFGLPASLHNALLVLVVDSLSKALPFTPGGAGTQQGLLVYVFAGKVSTTALLGFSVGMTIALTAVNVVFGFGAILLMLRTLRWRGRIDAPIEPNAARADLNRAG